MGILQKPCFPSNASYESYRTSKSSHTVPKENLASVIPNDNSTYVSSESYLWGCKFRTDNLWIAKHRGFCRKQIWVSCFQNVIIISGYFLANPTPVGWQISHTSWQSYPCLLSPLLSSAPPHKGQNQEQDNDIHDCMTLQDDVFVMCGVIWIVSCKHWQNSI